MPSYEEMRGIVNEIAEDRKKREERRCQERLDMLENMGFEPFDQNQIPPKRCDHPNTMEDSTATFIWIVAMIISILFKGGWVLCILETIVWFKFITRYKN